MTRAIKPVFSDNAFDTIIEKNINSNNEVAARRHLHQFTLYADL